MIDDFAKGLLASQKSMVGGSRACVRIDEKPLSPDDNPLTNNLVKYTNFFYTIRFQPSRANGLKDLPFLLKADILKAGRIRTKDYKGLYRLAENVPEVKWIINNCDITPDVFETANVNSYVDIPLRFKAGEYAKKIKSQLPNFPDYYPVLKEYNMAVAEMRRVEDFRIKKGKMTEEERFKEI